MMMVNVVRNKQMESVVTCYHCGNGPSGLPGLGQFATLCHQTRGRPEHSYCGQL